MFEGTSILWCFPISSSLVYPVVVQNISLQERMMPLRSNSTRALLLSMAPRGIFYGLEFVAHLAHKLYDHIEEEGMKDITQNHPKRMML